MRINYEESKLQQACVRFLCERYSHLAWNHSPNEGKRKEAQGALLKKLGMRPGWPDLEILHDETSLFIEFKSRTGTQENSQKEMQKTLETLGFRYYVCKSYLAFIDICHKELGPESDPDRKRLEEILKNG